MSSAFSVIFDMDGVLIDSPKYHWQAMRQALRSYGVNIADNKLHKYIGKPIATQIREISDEYDVELDCEKIRDQVAPIKNKLLENIQPKDGVVQLLELLKTHNIAMAVGTSSYREFTEQKLTEAGIIDYFKLLVTEEDVTEHKPSPKVYLTAAEQLGATPQTCVVFEDAPSGIQAAKSAGMICIAVQTTLSRAEDLKAADMIVASLREVDYGLIKKLLD